MDTTHLIYSEYLRVIYKLACLESVRVIFLVFVTYFYVLTAVEEFRTEEISSFIH
jgi:hypothetical protein